MRIDKNAATWADQQQAMWVRSVLDQYERPLLRYAAGIVGDVDHARDVVQDTFLKLWQKPPDRSGNHVAQWLYTVCRNRALDVRKKERRMKPLTDHTDQGRPAGDPSPPQALIDSETAGQVTAALAVLPENQQEVLRLKFQNGFSYKQIAGITGLSVSNVGYLIHVGIQALRSQLHSLGLLGTQRT